MAPPKKSQRDLMVQRLLEIYPDLPKRTAEDVLRHSGYDFDVAMGTLLAATETSRTSHYKPALNKLFDHYRAIQPGEEADRLYIDSTMEYLKDLHISLESIDVLLVSTLLVSPTMGEITREAFTTAWAKCEATDITQQRRIINKLNADLQASPLLKKQAADGIGPRTYKHTFTIALPSGTRAVPLEMATEYWKLLFSSQAGSEWKTPKTQWLDLWIEFMETKWKKAVNKDLWNQTLRFAQETLEDEELSFWSEDSAWPGVIDEFVGHVKQLRSAADSMDTT